MSNFEEDNVALIPDRPLLDRVLAHDGQAVIA